MALGVFVIANDFTALSVAIPRIEADLHTSLNRAQWVINGYALVFGVLIVTGGRLADMFGRKRMFMGGAIIWPAVLGLTYMILPASKKGLAGGLMYLPQFMEKVLGFSAIRSGAGLLPLMCLFAASSFAAGWLYGRAGPKVVVTAGTAGLAIGIFWLSFLTKDSSYASLVPGMLVLGTGIGLFYSSTTTAAVTALDPSRSSLAGGIVYMCQIAGGAVGLGLNTAIVLSAANLPDGIRAAFRVDAALAVIGTAVSLRFVRGAKRSEAHAGTSHAHHHRVRA